MKILLTKPDLEQFVEDQVNQGHFSSPSDVVEAASARFIQDADDEDFDEQTLIAIRTAEVQFDRGEGRPFGEVAAELREKDAWK